MPLSSKVLRSFNRTFWRWVKLLQLFLSELLFAPGLPLTQIGRILLIVWWSGFFTHRILSTFLHFYFIVIFTGLISTIRWLEHITFGLELLLVLIWSQGRWRTSAVATLSYKLHPRLFLLLYSSFYMLHWRWKLLFCLKVAWSLCGFRVFNLPTWLLLPRHQGLGFTLLV